MSNALERAMADRAATAGNAGTPQDARRVLIARLKEQDSDKIVKLVEKMGLPSSTGKWTLEQLREVVTTLEGAPVSAAPASPDRSFILVYNGENQLVSILDGAGWDALEPEEGQEAVLVNTPDDLGEVPTDVLLAVFNAGKGTKAKKFVDPSTAREQAFNSMAAIVDGTTAPAKVKAAAKPKTPSAPKSLNKEPKAQAEIKVVGAGTKIAQLIDLLARKEGTTVAEIESTLSATGKAVKAAAWLGYDLNKVAGYGVRQEGEQLFLVLPKGIKAPLAHKVKEAKAPAKPKAAAAAPAAEASVEEEVAVEEAAPAPVAPTVPAAAAKKDGVKKAAPAAPAKVAAAPAKKAAPPAKKGGAKK